ncbi:MAG TPA: TolC family protein, partial [Rhizomicrobium sp.]|nr:TolC family protein [Rhizomicrobium sp.]
MRHAVAIAAIAALAACAPPKAPVPPEAALTAPAGWRTTAPTADSMVAADWWKNFGDPVLANVVQTALAHNDDIAIAAARVAEARGQFRLAHAQLLPNIGAGAQLSREASINPGFGVPQTQTAGAGAIQISYDADLFGRLADS